MHVLTSQQYGVQKHRNPLTMLQGMQRVRIVSKFRAMRSNTKLERL
jgi:hypothetical protein